jgi:hypothetical protein
LGIRSQKTLSAGRFAVFLDVIHVVIGFAEGLQQQQYGSGLID